MQLNAAWCNSMQLNATQCNSMQLDPTRSACQIILTPWLIPNVTHETQYNSMQLTHLNAIRSACGAYFTQWVLLTSPDVPVSISYTMPQFKSILRNNIISNSPFILETRRVFAAFDRWTLWCMLGPTWNEKVILVKKNAPWLASWFLGMSWWWERPPKFSKSGHWGILRNRTFCT